MNYKTLVIEEHGPIVRVWLNRPDRLNALDATTLEEIATAFGALRSRYETQVIVFGGRGRAFCAGADRKDPPARVAAGSGAGPRERRYAAQVGRRAVQAIEDSEAITISRLHGYVIGGGVLLALCCDLRVAADDTVFHIPEVDLGIPLTWGGAPRLAREIGSARAKELILLCDRFDAATAERYGAVNRVVPAAELDAAVDDWAQRLAAKPPWAVHMTKTQFRAYSRTAVLGDVTEADGDMLTGAVREDPGLFAFTAKGDKKR